MSQAIVEDRTSSNRLAGLVLRVDFMACANIHCVQQALTLCDSYRCEVNLWL